MPKEKNPKVFELTIPRWNAAIPLDWQLEIAAKVKGGYGEFQSVSGTTIDIPAGTRLRGVPADALQSMLEQKFIQEVSTNADSQ